MTHAQCRAFAALPARMADLEMPPNPYPSRRERTTTLTEIEAVELALALALAPVKLPDADEAHGRAWLDRWAGERLPGFPTERLALFERFAYAGEHAPVDDRRSVPVWRVHFADGGPFLTYAVTSARAAALAYGRGAPGTGPGVWTTGAW